ncbi:MAG: TrkH family potassium uptake protein [Mogibacterium sp.]|nr:TrkH family potassium uptake protein [Mogibacterium sp.]
MKNIILGFYGFFLIFVAGCLAVPLLIALIYNETECIIAFLFAILITILPGMYIRTTRGVSFEEGNLKLRYSYLLVSSAWIIATVVGSLPFIMSGSIPDFIDALFETCSGFTTTGSTILSDVEALPRSILFWRCLTQWLGGMGIMVLFVALLPGIGIKARNIASAETPGPTVTKVSSRFFETARLLYVAYIVLTVVLIVLLLLGGMSLYDAVCHAMTCMATGGYSTYNDGISHFNSPYIYWILTLFMFIAGTNFNLFFFVIKGKISKLLGDDEFRFYLISVLLAIVLVVISLMTEGHYTDLFKAVTDSAFQVVTIVSTTGYATANFIKWPAFAQMILVILMLTGASSSSTSGGIKEVRVLVFIRMIRFEIKRILHASIVDDIKYNGKKMAPETLTYIMTFLSTYFVTLLVGTFLISVTGDGNLVSNFTAALTCISNVGPGLDMVGPECNFHFYSGFGKLVLSFLMVAGRLELSTFMIIFTRHFWRHDSL